MGRRGRRDPATDADLDEVIVTPSKVAGLTVISRELAEDTTPEAAEVVGDGLARDIARRIDQAFFGNLAAPAPPGLGSLSTTAGNVQLVRGGANEVQTLSLGAATAGTVTITFAGQTTAAIAFNATAATVQAALEALSNIDPGDVTVTGGPLPGTMALTFGGQYAGLDVGQVTVTPTGLTGGTVTVNTTQAGGGGFTNLDPFAAALSKAEGVGALITAWVAAPETALTLGTLKESNGSNKPLLGSDPSVPTRRMILGVPLLPSPAVAAGTVWGMAASRVTVVVRRDTEVTSDRSVFFTSDRVAVRGTMRAGFGFPHQAAIVKITV
jgi:hypothetical protein